MILQRQINACGLSCPMPAVKTALALEDMDAGEVLELLSDDPVSKRDIPAWCEETGNKIIRLQETGSIVSFLIEKG